MNRRLLLKSTLRDNFTEQFINRFENYTLGQEELQNLSWFAHNFLTGLDTELTSSPIISSLFVVSLKKEADLPLVLIAGELHYSGARLFSVDKVFPTANKPIDPMAWTTAHFWIECGGCIIDLSLLKRVDNDEVKQDPKQMIEERLGSQRGAMIAPAETFEKYGFSYVPHHSLSAYQIAELSQAGQSLVRNNTV